MLACSKKRILSMVLSIALVLSVVGVIPVSATEPDDAVTYHNLGTSGAIAIDAGDGDYEISGSYDDTATPIRIEDGYNGTITLNNVHIRSNNSCITFDNPSGTTNVVIELVGTNTLEATSTSLNHTSYPVIGQGPGKSSNHSYTNPPCTFTITGDSLIIRSGTSKGMSVSNGTRLILDADSIDIVSASGHGITAPAGITLESGDVSVTAGKFGVTWRDGAILNEIKNGATITSNGHEGNYFRYVSTGGTAGTYLIDLLGTATLYKLTVEAQAGGSAVVFDNNDTFGIFEEGEEVRIVATPDLGMAFDEWGARTNSGTSLVNTNLEDRYAEDTVFVMPGQYATVTAKFKPGVAVTSITVTSDADSITTKGGTLQMSADVQPDNASNKNVTWSVSGSAATIDSNGLLTAQANGTVTVKATAADGSNVYGEKTITISDQDTTPTTVPVTSVTVSSSANSITTKGGTLQMSANVQPGNASNKNVTWSISGTGATINSSTGLLTATANGKVTVRATAADGSGKYGEKVITISGQDTTMVPVTSITVNSSANSITTKGGALQMSANVQPGNASNKNVTWTVNGSAATIDSNGLLTAQANGKVTVKATAVDGSNVYGEKTITISGQDTTAPTVPVASITVNSSANSITTKGGTMQMSANVQPDNASNKNVTWTVNGSAATINSNTGLLTAKANGTVTVRATATDGSGKYGEKVITISGQSNGGNSSSGSGSSGSSDKGSSKPDSFNTTSGTGTATSTTEWVNTPNSGSAPSTSSGKAGIKAGDWQKLTGAVYAHDTLDGNSVQVRVTISNPSRWKQEAMLSGYIKGQNVDSIRFIFENWYSNNIRVIYFDQQADWEQLVNVAAKVDLTGMDADNLVFYSYTRSNNTYRRIADPNYYIDANGYLRFVTPYAGSIVISDGTLVKK